MAALVLATALVYFGRLGATPFFDGDEPRYAQAAREMAARGDWLTPTFNDALRFEKPIFIYWCILACYRLSGEGEAAARLPAALAAFALVPLMLGFALPRVGRAAALFAACAAAFNIQAMVLGGAATPDAMLCLFTTGSLLAFYHAFTTEEEGARRGYWAFWGLAGLAALTKGPVGLGIPLLVAALFALCEGRLGKWLREGRFLPGLAFAALLAGPWYAAMVALHGDAFTGYFFGREHLGRFTQTMERHSGPFFYYPVVTLVFFFPWSAFVPAGLLFAARSRSQGRPDAPDLRLGRFALVWTGVVFFLFTLSQTKLPHYVYPAYPAMALLAAVTFRRLLAGSCTAGQARGVLWLGGVLTLVGGVLTLAAPVVIERLETTSGFGSRLPPLALVGLFAALAATAVGWWSVAQRREAPALAGLGGGSALLIASLGLLVAPYAHERIFGGMVRLSRLAASGNPPSRLGVWRGVYPAAVYYFNRGGVRLGLETPDEVVRWRDDGAGALLLTKRKNVAALGELAEPVAADGKYVLVRVRREPGQATRRSSGRVKVGKVGIGGSSSVVRSRRSHVSRLPDAPLLLPPGAPPAGRPGSGAHGP